MLYEASIPHSKINVEFRGRINCFLRPTSDNSPFMRPVVVNSLPIPALEISTSAEHLTGYFLPPFTQNRSVTLFPVLAESKKFWPIPVRPAPPVPERKISLSLAAATAPRSRLISGPSPAGAHASWWTPLHRW